jgi:uncharacterized protein
VRISTRAAESKRLGLYLVLSFGVTWALWWPLTRLVPSGSTPLKSGLDAALYVLGGLGPTFAALAAVALTPGAGSLREYGARLVRWRVGPTWWLVALCGPFALAYLLVRLILWMHPMAAEPVASLSRALVLFPIMVLGGGLEEFGWRGVAQPVLQRRLPLLAACTLIGVLWALWHLPLFYLHGVPQFAERYLPFAVGVLANALLLGWLYANTGSILLCALFHAAANTSSAIGLELPAGAPRTLWLGTRLALGVALILLTRGSQDRAPSPRTVQVQGAAPGA